MGIKSMEELKMILHRDEMKPLIDGYNRELEDNNKKERELETSVNFNNLFAPIKIPAVNEVTE